MDTDYMLLFDEEKLFEMYSALPENMKRAIFSVDGAARIMNIGRKHGLTVDQIGIVGHQTGLVMVGALHPRRFIQELEKRLGIERAKAADIAKDINHELFFPIREALKRIHNIEDTEGVISEDESEKSDILQKIAERRIIGQFPPAPPYRPSIPPFTPPGQQPPIARPATQPPAPPLPPQNLPTSVPSAGSQPSRGAGTSEVGRAPLGAGSRSLQEKFAGGQGRPLPEWAKPKAEAVSSEARTQPEQSYPVSRQQQPQSGQFVQQVQQQRPSVPDSRYPRGAAGSGGGQGQQQRPAWQPPQPSTRPQQQSYGGQAGQAFRPAIPQQQFQRKPPPQIPPRPEQLGPGGDPYKEAIE